ncbi:MAG: hypothetical protein QOF35_491 [Actinomycetota bacterium]|nr:hypothetical protein [Actinomycetota bacterium]
MATRPRPGSIHLRVLYPATVCPTQAPRRDLFMVFEGNVVAISPGRFVQVCENLERWGCGRARVVLQFYVPIEGSSSGAFSDRSLDGLHDDVAR